MRVALIQMKVTRDPDYNLKHANELLNKVSDADLIVFPEYFLYPVGTPFDRSTDEILDNLKKMAKRSGKILVAGTIPEQTETKVYNTCYVISPKGEIMGKYRKSHMFDVSLPGLKTQESDIYSSGHKTEVIKTPFGKIGLAVCFDLRFPEIFIEEALDGAETIIVPAAFSKKTGPQHWEHLIRSRALDSQTFVVGCGCAENDDLDFKVYGRSCISGPDGNIIAQVDGDEQIILCDYEPKEVSIARKVMPVMLQRMTLQADDEED